MASLFFSFLELIAAVLRLVHPELGAYVEIVVFLIIVVKGMICFVMVRIFRRRCGC